MLIGKGERRQEPCVGISSSAEWCDRGEDGENWVIWEILRRWIRGVFMVTNWMWHEGKEGARKEPQIPGWAQHRMGHLGGRKSPCRDDNGKCPGLRCRGSSLRPQEGATHLARKGRIQEICMRKRNPFWGEISGTHKLKKNNNNITEEVIGYTLRRWSCRRKSRGIT